MTNGQTLPTSTQRRLRTFSPEDAKSFVGTSLPNSDGNPPPAQVLQTANEWTWTTLEMLLAGERVCVQASEDDSGFAACLCEAVDALLGQVTPEEFRRADPEWRQMCWQQLRLARQAGLLHIDLPNVQKSTGLFGECNDRQIVGHLADTVERSTWYCLRPLLEMEGRQGELLCFAILAWFSQKSLGLELKAGLSPESDAWDGALSLVTELLEGYPAQLAAALRDACGPLPGAAIQPVVDTMAAALRFQRGLGCIQNGEYERAIVEFSAAIQHNPSMEHAYAQRGDAHRMLGVYDRALADYTAALRINPVNSHVLINRGQTSQMLGRPQQAISDYDVVLQLDPNSVVALNHRGTARAELGDRDPAIADFTQALTIDPNYPFTYQNRARVYAARGDLDAAIVDYGHVLHLNPMFTLAHVRRGDIYRQKGELTQAIADYTEALRLDPMHLHAYVNRGAAYQEQGQPNRALSDFASALKLDGANPRLFLNRGIANRDNGDLSKALSDFDAALGLDPDNPQIYFHRALARQQMGDSELALADLDEAIRRKPDAADAYFHRGTLRVVRRETAEAISDLSEAIRLDPSNPHAYLSRAQAHWHNTELDSVIDDCSRAIDLDAALSRAYMTRGTAYYRRGENARALADFECVLKFNPTDAEAMVNQGAVHARMGHHDAAVAGLTQALQITPKNARALAARANSYRAQEQHEAALADYAQAFQQDLRYTVAFCNQRAFLNMKMGDLDMALADCALSLLVEPGNRKALRLREQLLNSTAFEVVDDASMQPPTGRTETKLTPLPVIPKKPVPKMPPKMASASAFKATEVPVASHTDPDLVIGGTVDRLEPLPKSSVLKKPPRMASASGFKATEVPVAAHTDLDLVVGGTAEPTTDEVEVPNETADSEAAVGPFAAERESAARGSAGDSELLVKESDTAEYEKEQQLLNERLKREKAAQQARLEQQRQEEEEEIRRLREEQEAKRRGRRRTNAAGDEEGTSPWLRRAAAVAAVLVLGYLIGPMVWSYAMSPSYPQNDKDDVEAEVKVTAAQLCKRFLADAASAQTEYGERVVEVSGIIKDIRKDAQDNTLIVLMDDRKEGRLECKMPPPKSVSQGSMLSKLDALGSVTLKGKCTGQEGKIVHLDDVHLVQVRSR